MKPLHVLLLLITIAGASFYAADQYEKYITDKKLANRR